MTGRLAVKICGAGASIVPAVPYSPSALRPPEGPRPAPGRRGWRIGGQQVTDLRSGAGRSAVPVEPNACRFGRVSGTRFTDRRSRPRYSSWPLSPTQPAPGSHRRSARRGPRASSRPCGPASGAGPRAVPPGRQHLAGRDLIRALPGHQHQIPQQRGHHLAIVRVRQHAHQQSRADGQASSPSLASPFTFPVSMACAAISSITPGPASSSSCRSSAPSRAWPAGCPPPWIHRRGGPPPARPPRSSRTPADPRHGIPGVRPPPAPCGHPQPAPGRKAAPIRRPYRDQRRGPRQPGRQISAAGVAGAALTCGNGAHGRSAVELHVGLLCEDWRRIPLLLAREPSCITRSATPVQAISSQTGMLPDPACQPSCARPAPTGLSRHRNHSPSPQTPASPSLPQHP